jgi:small subunit ribosomal protein S8
MSHDIIADALNMIKNAKKAGKENIEIKSISNLLIEILKIMKQEKAIKKYKIDAKEKTISLTIGDLSDCRAVKPRFSCDKGQVEKYRRRYLPARNLGTLIISTNKGLMTHKEAQEEKTGGCVIAYFY